MTRSGPVHRCMAYNPVMSCRFAAAFVILLLSPPLLAAQGSA